MEIGICLNCIKNIYFPIKAEFKEVVENEEEESPDSSFPTDSSVSVKQESPQESHPQVNRRKDYSYIMYFYL